MIALRFYINDRNPQVGEIVYGGYEDKKSMDSGLQFLINNATLQL